MSFKKSSILILFWAFVSALPAQSVQRLDVASFAQLLASKPNVQLIDVRTPSETASGIIKNAIVYDISAPEFSKSIQKLDKKRPVAVYCAAGGRSARAAQQLAALGYQVYDLSGGMTAWRSNGRPVVKK